MIKIDISKCTGCRMCETACVFFHTGRTGRFKSRIKVINIYEDGIDGPVVCQQCIERYCTECPENAISIGRNGQVIISHTVCNYCNKCIRACPIGAIELYDETYHVCDLCGGSPRCVEDCTEGAIVYLPNESESISLEEFKKNSKGKNNSERQLNFVKSSGFFLRKKWREKHA
ncbi:4Fe-4S dicluster domain-containing protein [Bacteroidota bacterium]